MPNANFKPDTKTYDLDPTQPQTPQTEEKDVASILAEREEKWAARLEQQQAAANRRFSELYEQTQIQSRAMMDLLKTRSPEPDYSSNDNYFQDSYSQNSPPPTTSLTPEKVQEIAAQAAKETFEQTVTEGTKRQQQVTKRESELAKYFEDQCKDLHGYRQAVLSKYQQAKQNFPNASTDDQFSWALDTVRSVVAVAQTPPTQKENPRISPVGTGGTTRSPRDTPSDQHREMLRRSDEEVMRSYYAEEAAYEKELEQVFDQW